MISLRGDLPDAAGVVQLAVAMMKLKTKKRLTNVAQAIFFLLGGIEYGMYREFIVFFYVSCKRHCNIRKSGKPGTLGS